MTEEYILQKLIEQKNKIKTGNVEVWLKTTHAYLVEYFKSYSPRVTNFQSLINDYNLVKIGVSEKNEDFFWSTGLEYIEDNIQHLKEIIQSKEVINLNTNNNNFKEKIIPDDTSIQKERIIYKTQLPFGIPAALFWTIFAALIGGAYFVGKDNGSSKFDKEKMDYYEENKNLKSDTLNLHKTIKEKDLTIKIKDSIIIEKKDSIKEMDEKLTGLYLYIGSKK